MPWKLFGIKRRDRNLKSNGLGITGSEFGKHEFGKVPENDLIVEPIKLCEPQKTLFQEWRKRSLSDRDALLERSFESVIAFLRSRLPSLELARLDELLAKREAQLADQTQPGGGAVRASDKAIAQLVTEMSREDQHELEALLIQAGLHPVQVIHQTD